MRRLGLLVCGALVACGGPSSSTTGKSNDKASCQPPDPALLAEVDRLLAAAAHRMTRSGVCYDGQAGQQVRVLSRTACLRGEASDERIDIDYAFERVPEADTRGCVDEPCVEPASQTEHHQSLRMRQREGRRVLIVPERIDGMGEASTPLSKEHDADCYGTSVPFEPAELD